MKHFRSFDLLLTGLHNAEFECWPHVDPSLDRPGHISSILDILEGVLCLRMGWPPVFRNDTCFSDCEMCSCQSNVDCVSLVGCMPFSEAPGAGRSLKKLTSATCFLLFSVRQFHSLVSQVNPPRSDLVAGYINASLARLRGTLWELLWANTIISRMGMSVWLIFTVSTAGPCWEFPPECVYVLFIGDSGCVGAGPSAPPMTLSLWNISQCWMWWMIGI